MIKREYRDIQYPCNLRIKLIPDFSESLISTLKEFVNLVFDSFFYNIFIIPWFLEPQSLINRSREELKGDITSFREKVLVYPTNLFYTSLKDLQDIQFITPINLGVTNLPLYSSSEKNLIFLYGEAHIPQKCAVVSTYNLCDININLYEDSIIIEQRIIKECIHELGHLILGNNHCMNSYCVMNYSSNLQKVDQKSTFPCDSCHKKLEDIRENYNF